MNNDMLPEFAPRDVVSIAGIYIEPDYQGARVGAWVHVEVDNHTHDDQQVMATIIVQLGEIQEKIEVVDWVEPQGGLIEAVIRIEEPELWWPRGYGDQTLYTCMVGLSANGAVQDAAQQRFGVRSVAFLENGEEPILLVNGEEIPADPSVWAPPDQFVPAASKERYQKLVNEASEAGAIMIKAWGEGSDEDSAFYDACDEQGLLIWQELVPGAVTSPSDALADMVAEHVSEHIKNLRNHPSIAVWCGAADSTEATGGTLADEIIPRVVGELDKTRPYLPHCPDPA